jgi:hypothetical protein
MKRCASGPSPPKPDATSCAIAAYHGSWEPSDEQFASAVRVSASTNRVSNFAIPDDGLPSVPVSDARLEISNRWQEATMVKKTAHLGSSLASSLDQPTGRTIIAELDGGAPAMFIQPEINVRQQLFATSRRCIILSINTKTRRYYQMAFDLRQVSRDGKGPAQDRHRTRRCESRKKGANLPPAKRLSMLTHFVCCRR